MRRYALSGVLLLMLLLSAVLLLTGPEDRWGEGLPGHVLYPPEPVPVLGQQLRGRWSLVQLSGRQCKSDCRRLAVRLKRIQNALGEDGRRIQRLLVLPAGTRHPRWEDTELQVWLMGEAQRRRLEEACGSEAVCLVDPEARLVVRYRADAASRIIHDDISLLLRVS